MSFDKYIKMYITIQSNKTTKEENLGINQLKTSQNQEEKLEKKIVFFLLLVKNF